MATSSHVPSTPRLRPRRFFSILLGSAALAGSVAHVDRTAAGVDSARPTCAGAGAARTFRLQGLAPAQVRTRSHPPATVASYDWPLKPFNRQHPVRAFFDDPRIGRRERVFHFGIDIAAADGSPVYAVAPGRVWVHGESVAVVSAGRVFGYWHVRPVVSTNQHVAHHQLIGYVMPGWGHVHFAESQNHRYRNPLRPGGIGPYRDVTPPTVVAAGAADGSAVAAGRVALVADTFDTTSPRVPGAWHDEPVTPALVRWRLLHNDRAATAWATAADFRTRLLPGAAFDRIYSAATRQNHRGDPGLFCFNLARAFETRSLPNGAYRLQVSASDTYGNRSVATVELTIANGGPH